MGKQLFLITALATALTFIGPADRASAFPPPHHQDRGQLDFAGMYGGYWDPNANISREYVNPITNASSCPYGYNVSTVLGTVNLDYGIGLCSRPHEYGRHPEYDFGGAYGYTTNSVPYPNPVTGAASCPAGFTAVTVHGSVNLDWPVVFCYRPHRHGMTSVAKFGGFFGYGADAHGQTVTFLNPANNSALCPPGYRTTQISGTYGLDYGLFVCTQ